MTDTKWLLLSQGKMGAAYNMAADEALLQSAPTPGRPVLRFYGWLEGAATFGYSQKYGEIEKLTLLRPLVRRPTGGGLVPHDTDWTYSLIFPPDHSWYFLKATESYRRAHALIRDAFGRLNVATTLAPGQIKGSGQCFIGAEKNDVLWQGRKIAGAAQRRTHNGLLVQGSVQPPPLGLKREDWEKAMRETMKDQFSLQWENLKPSDELEESIEHLRQTKYSQEEYNRKR